MAARADDSYRSSSFGRVYYAPLRPETPAAAKRDRQLPRVAPPSALFDRIQDRGVAHDTAAPEFFVDLNLNQIVEAITAHNDAFGL
jgi:hypothetical protein